MSWDPDSDPVNFRGSDPGFCSPAGRIRIPVFLLGLILVKLKVFANFPTLFPIFPCFSPPFQILGGGDPMYTNKYIKYIL